MPEPCEQVQPEQIQPDEVPAALMRVYAVHFFGPTSEASTRAALAAVLTQVREQVACAVEKACISPEWPGDDVSANGALAAAVVRSWPEDVDG